MTPEQLRKYAFIFLVLSAGVLFYVKLRNESAINKQLEELESTWKQKEVEWEEKLNDPEVEEMKELAKHPYRGRTLTTENRLVFQNYTVSDRHAFVTMIGSTSHVHPYWMGALAMIQSLREVETRVPNIVVMVRKTELIPSFAMDAFERLGAQLRFIDNLPMSELNVEIPGTWEGAFDKLNVWKLVEFEKVVFLDVDTLIVQNIDHLFNLPELTAPYTPTNCQCHADFVKTPQYFTISSGFFVCKPSMERFNQMLTLASGPSPDPDDLAQFGGTWHWGDQEMLRVVFTQLSNEWTPLNWEYDLPVGMCSCPQRRTKPIYSYHFVCTYPVPKPWSDPLGPLHFQRSNIATCVMEIYNLWYRLLAKALNYHNLDETVVNIGKDKDFQPIADANNRVLWG